MAKEPPPPKPEPAHPTIWVRGYHEGFGHTKSWIAKDGARFNNYGAAAHERMMEPPRISVSNPHPHIGQGRVVTRRSHRRPFGGLFALTLRLAISAILLVYVLPHVLQPTPEVILNARQFVSASIEDAAAEFASPDVARSIDQVVEAISR